MSNESGRYIFLGYPLSPQSPTPPAIPPLNLSPFMSLARGDDANVTRIEVVSHTGTHIDVPYHVCRDGFKLSDFRAEDFIFSKPLVVDLALRDGEVVLPQHLEPCVKRAAVADLLLFRFGYGEVRRTEPARFSSQCPGFGVESARYLLEHFPRLRAIGMDVPSLSCIACLEQSMPAHNVLLEGKGRRFIIIEDMNLEQDLSTLSQVIVAPWYIDGLDGAPATIFGKAA